MYWLPDEISLPDLRSKLKATTTFQGHKQDTAQPQHPGRFCERGCFAELFNFGSDGLWAHLERDRAGRETASIIVRLMTPGKTPFDALKLYLDRNIRRTAPRDTAPENCEYIELEPGDHTLIVRDYDYRNPERRQSNQIRFTIRDGEQIEFYLREVEGCLYLEPKDESNKRGV